MVVQIASGNPGERVRISMPARTTELFSVAGAGIQCPLFAVEFHQRALDPPQNLRLSAKDYQLFWG